MKEARQLFSLISDPLLDDVIDEIRGLVKHHDDSDGEHIHILYALASRERRIRLLPLENTK